MIESFAFETALIVEDAAAVAVEVRAACGDLGEHGAFLQSLLEVAWLASREDGLERLSSRVLGGKVTLASGTEARVGVA